MTLFYIFFISLVIAVGASCTGDLTRLQSQLSYENFGLDFYEPFFAIVARIIRFFFIDQSVALIHLMSVFLLLFAFRLYFLSTNLISKKSFYLISFIFIFNPLTLQIVTDNTRQLFFTALISFPIYYFCANMIRNNFKSQYSIKKEKILNNRLIPITMGVFALGTHSSFPLIFINFTILFFVFYFLKFFYAKIKFSIPKSINLRNFIYFCFVSPLLIFFLYKISDRLLYVFKIYGPFINTAMAENYSMMFDSGSPSLVFSALINLSLFFYLGFKIPARYLIFKALMFSTFLNLVLPFLMALTFPFLSNFLARSYQPIVLLYLPLALVLLKEYINMKYINFIIVVFMISSVSLQTQKYLDFDNKSNFYGLGNEQKYSCSLVPFRE